MRGGLVTSVMLHAAILGWALFTIQSQRELRAPEPEPIAVDLVNASDLTRLRQGARTAKEREAEAKETKPEPARKEAPKPAPVAAAPPPPAADPPKEEPPPPAAAPPVPAPDEQKRLEEMLKEQERRAEEQRQAEEQKRLAELKKQQEEARKKAAELKKKREAEKKRKEAEAKKQKSFEEVVKQALLNKVPDKGAPTPSAPLDQQAKAKGPALGAPEGRDRQISASEIAVLRSIISRQLSQCWRLPASGGGVDMPVVTLRWRFRPDGNLDGDPHVEQPRSDPLFQLAAETAVRAVQQCAPFPLPVEKYSQWKTITWEFDPSAMRGQ